MIITMKLLWIQTVKLTHQVRLSYKFSYVVLSKSRQNVGNKLLFYKESVCFELSELQN